jgi:two-component sensor histidine kinase/CheY-like chemotaxis protein
MAELDHRVKNTIANIQALVVQTSRSADTLTGFVEDLDGRIQSMAKAHSLLSQSRWEGVSIDKLLGEELNAYASGGSAVVLSGRDVLLTPKSALSLSLAVHELATNAGKYGALSTPGGCVTVNWRMADDGGIELSWIETGGPPVKPPARLGFGSTLIERALAMETGGRAINHYLRTGVVCEVFLPSSSVSHSDALAPAPPSGEPVMREMAANQVQEAFRILVVEDSFLLVMALEMVFDDLGWKIIGPATRKADALALMHVESFDAALLDVNLDGEMSWEIAALLKERRIPFVFSTGYDVTSVLPDFLVGSAVIGKPYKSDELEWRLRQVITDARADRLKLDSNLGELSRSVHR